MSKPYVDFEPKWIKDKAPEKSVRSIFRWGDPNFVKYPKESLYKLMKEKFKMTDEDFNHYHGDIGLDEVKLNIPSKIKKE
ncbi:MAG: FAD-binding oxidoreductase, partial [Clostridia bacterium]